MGFKGGTMESEALKLNKKHEKIETKNEFIALKNKPKVIEVYHGW